MGKVGSISIVEALTDIGMQVFHVHFLNPDRLARIAKRHQEQAIPIRGHYLNSFTVKEDFLEKGRPVKFITAVRDPIARNISGYFQSLKDFRPLKRKFEEEELQAMMAEFLEKYQHNYPLTWLDMEIKTALGVDFYKHSFPKNDGVQRIQENGRDILLLKAEAADHLKVAAIKEFLQIPEFSLKTKNVGTEKAYAHYYKPFLGRIQLPAAYLDKMYESRYVRHFYTSEEISQFRERWTRDLTDKTAISPSSSRPTGTDQPGGNSLPLPPKNLMFMDPDVQSFITKGDALVRWLKRDTHYDHHCVIVDISCGYGRLAHALLRDADFQGSYRGIDILPKHVQWCKDNLACDGIKKVSFQHVDVLNGRYNKKGKLSTADVKVDIAPNSVDIVCFLSVFTHMYHDDMRNYLRLARQLLKRGGEIFCTFFLMNESWRNYEKAGKSSYPMSYALNDFCSFHNKQDPLHAIAYREEFIVALFKECDFHVEKINLGKWCGRKGVENSQDILVATAR
jgi:SAM-dependent methyltransferase